MGGWYIYFLMYTGVYSIVFILIHSIAVANSPRAWNRWDSAVIGWGVVYAFVAIYFSYPGSWLSQVFPILKPYGDFLGLLSLIGVPSAISMALVYRAWKSRVVVLWMLLGASLAYVMSVLIEQVGLVFIGPVVWNASYGVGCALIYLKYHPLPNQNECLHCSYSLIGLPKDLPCPECGQKNSDLVAKL